MADIQSICPGRIPASRRRRAVHSARTAHH
jgi:hypothetical protein